MARLQFPDRSCRVTSSPLSKHIIDLTKDHNDDNHADPASPPKTALGKRKRNCDETFELHVNSYPLGYLEDSFQLECVCCFEQYDHVKIAQCNEGHLFCCNCFRKLAETAIAHNQFELRCVDLSGCSAAFPRQQMAKFLPGSVVTALDRLEADALVSNIGFDGLYECPFCGDVKIDDSGGTDYTCSEDSCGRTSCKSCRQAYHPHKSCRETDQNDLDSARHRIEEVMTAALLRTCKNCSISFLKESGCNKMTCPKCQQKMCYVCKLPNIDYSHFGTSCPLFDDVDARHNNDVLSAQRDAVAKEAALDPALRLTQLQVDGDLQPKDNMPEQTHYGIPDDLQRQLLHANRALLRHASLTDKGSTSRVADAAVVSRLRALRAAQQRLQAQAFETVQDTKERNDNGEHRSNQSPKIVTVGPRPEKSARARQHESSLLVGSRQIGSLPSSKVTQSRRPRSPMKLLNDTHLNEAPSMDIAGAGLPHKGIRGGIPSSPSSVADTRLPDGDFRSISPSQLGRPLSSPIAIKSSPVQGLGSRDSVPPRRVLPSSPTRAQRKKRFKTSRNHIPPQSVPSTEIADVLAKAINPAKALVFANRHTNSGKLEASKQSRSRSRDLEPFGRQLLYPDSEDVN